MKTAEKVVDPGKDDVKDDEKGNESRTSWDDDDDERSAAMGPLEEPNVDEDEDEDEIGGWPLPGSSPPRRT